VTEKRTRTTFRQDKRRKHHHWVVTLFYGDGQKFERVYISPENARRFAKRQLKSPIVIKATMRRLS
jgi:hypothetical protein